MSVRATDRHWSANTTEIRKQRVASLLIRGLKTHEIVTALAQNLINPTTGKPFNRKTIERDIKELQAEWRTQTAEEIATYYGHMLATALEVQRAAWGSGNMALVLECNAEMRAIIGKPLKTENTHITIDWSSLSDQQLRVMREGLKAGRSVVEIMAGEDWPK